jgi:hypothetical protein
MDLDGSGFFFCTFAIGMKPRVVLAVQALLVVGLLSAGLHAQSVGIGTSTPHPSARLHIEDNARGLLIPNVALTATNVAAPVTSPATSLLVYNTNTAGTGATAVTPGFYYWNGSQWVRLADGGKAWLLTGNAGTNPAINFLGTTDAQPLVIRTNNIERMRVTATGNVGIGTTTPDHQLVVGPAGGGRWLVINDIPDARWGFSTGYFDLAIQNDNDGIPDGVGGGNWTTRVLITENGDVGIGTTAPSARLHVVGNFVATGTKSAIIETKDFGVRKLYCMEAPTIRFYDEGKAMLENGIARIELDPVFVQTIEGELLVHITPEGPTPLYVAEKGSNYFVVKSINGPDVPFVWQVSAFRKGYKDVRLERVNQSPTTYHQNE